MKKITILLIAVFLSGCFGESTESKNTAEMGKLAFEQNCAGCHGKKGQGIANDWRKKLPDGSFPPPPLNGTAHTWHHSPEQLLWVINNGGAQFGGKMPGFKDKLSDEEKQAILDYIYSLWPKELKIRYDEAFKL